MGFGFGAWQLELVNFQPSLNNCWSDLDSIYAPTSPSPLLHNPGILVFRGPYITDFGSALYSIHALPSVHQSVSVALVEKVVFGEDPEAKHVLI